MNLSLRAKLLLAFFLLIAIPCIVLGYLSYRQASNALKSTIEDELENAAKSTAHLVEASISATQKMVEVASDKSEFTIAAMTSTAGSAQAAMQKLREGNANLIEDVVLADRNGQILATASNSAVASIKDRDYFSKGMNGQATVSDVLISKVSHNPVVVVGQPLRQDGRIIGVLGAVINFGSLVQSVSEIKVGETGYGFMLDKTGLIVHHPDQSMVLKTNMLQEKDEQVRAVAQKLISGQPGKAIYTFQGVEKLVAYAPAGQFVTVVTVPVAEYMAPAKVILQDTAIIVFVAVTIALAIAYMVATSIVNPVARLRELMAAAGDGDLTEQVKVDRQDEIGQMATAFNTMVIHLRTLVKQITANAEQVAASSEELTASSEQSAQAANQIAGAIAGVATGATEQMTAANETSAVVEQMSAGIQQVAANANQVAARSAQAADKAKDGGKAVEKAVSQMNQIEETVNTSARVVAKLGERSKEIGQIVDTIAGIAGQTNLLALNAAIEAARAGEQGRGFAVVAEEVRKLAEQSQEATQQIAALIGEIQGDTDKAVVAMNEGTVEVKTGAEVVNAAGAAFREIADLVIQVSGQVKEISAAIQQMAAGSQQIVGSIRKIDDLGKKSAGEAQSVSAATEEQLASMEEIASSSQALAKLAQDLRTAVDRFRV